MDRCENCNGTGQANWGEEQSRGGVGGYVMQTRRCDDCRGTGYRVDCWRCFDTGEVALEKRPDGTWNLGGEYGPCPCSAGPTTV